MSLLHGAGAIVCGRLRVRDKLFDDSRPGWELARCWSSGRVGRVGAGQELRKRCHGDGSEKRRAQRYLDLDKPDSGLAGSKVDVKTV